VSKVNIDLGNGYRITADKYQWILQKFDGIREDGTERWASEGYYPDIGILVRELAHKRVRLSEASSFADVLDNWKNVCAELTRVLTGVVEIVPGFERYRPGHREGAV